jgi:hypothetical protein
VRTHPVDPEKAEVAALARMLKVWTSPAAKSDGTDMVREALDDTSFLRDVAKHLASEVQSGGTDDAPLAKLLRDRVHAYCRSCPCFEDYTSEAAADLNDTSDEDEARDRELEREPS